MTYTRTGEHAASDRERLILEHLTQVHMIARRIHERLPVHVPIDDLISTGILGLISAIDNFDPSKNVQLKTYAEYKIRGAILDSLRELDWAPRKMRKKAKLIQAAVETGKRRFQREPSEEEIAAELKVPVEEYRKWLAEIQGLELEALEYAGDQEGRDLLRFIADSDDKLPSRLFEQAELESLIAQAIDKMPKAERTVLSLYYREELNLREIGEVMHMHPSRISQLKTQAILRLRSYIRSRWASPGRERGVPAERTVSDI